MRNEGVICMFWVNIMQPCNAGDQSKKADPWGRWLPRYCIKKFNLLPVEKICRTLPLRVIFFMQRPRITQMRIATIGHIRSNAHIARPGLEPPTGWLHNNSPTTTPRRPVIKLIWENLLVATVKNIFYGRENSLYSIENLTHSFYAIQSNTILSVLLEINFHPLYSYILTRNTT